MSVSKGWRSSLIIVSIGAIAAIYWLIPWTPPGDISKKGVFIPLKIEGFSSSDIPYCSVRIENKTLHAKIDLGYEGNLSLPAQFLNQIKKKQFLKQSRHYGLCGKPYSEDVYKLKKVTVGNIDFSPKEIHEMSPELEDEALLVKGKDSPIEELGRIGWHLFEGFNFLVDCKNEQFVLCDSLETLRSRGYPVDSFAKTPFILTHGLIEFEAITDTGSVCCVLDTGATWNMHNQRSATPQEGRPLFDPKDTFDTSIFRIGNKEFGPITFNRIYSPVPLQAILGMEFFRDTLVFLDFENKLAYFYEYPKVPASEKSQEAS